MDSNLVYAVAPALDSPYVGESATHLENLTLDIFQPGRDTLSLRPVVIFAHSGAFIKGTKENDDMVAFCDSLSEKGYVTVTIDYRLGIFFSASSATRAVYRGLQDSRAAVRYLKANAASLRIDTNNVFFLGSSAGAFMALQNIYMNEESKRPKATYQVSNMLISFDDGPDLGGLDAIDSLLKYGGQPKAVVSLWGAVEDTTLIDSTNYKIPVLLVHGTADNIVPFNVGYPFQLPLLPETYGSYPISIRLKNLGNPAETYFVTGAGHEFYGVNSGMWNPAPNAYWDTVLTLVTNFLYNQTKPYAKFSNSISGDTVMFTNLTAGSVSWYWSFGDSSYSTDKNPKHIYSTGGTYKVTLTALNKIESWDTVSSVIITTPTLVDEKTNETPVAFSLSQNYPNPFNPTTTIQYSLPSPSKVKDPGSAGGEGAGVRLVTLKIYNLLGQEVATLVDKQQQAGIYKVEFNTQQTTSQKQLSSGIYFYRLTVGKFSEVKKLLFLK